MILLFPNPIFAYSPIDTPIYVGAVVMLSGFALLYSKELSVRLAGIGF